MMIAPDMARGSLTCEGEVGEEDVGYELGGRDGRAKEELICTRCEV
jgi:hypothetical protein